MFGGGSIQLARVLGIRIGVEPSWFLVLFLIIWSLSGEYGDLFPGEDAKSFALAVISALLFFVCVLLHELGHAVVAIRNGIGIQGIDLWLFGGVAKMERDTDSAGVEFRVAVAGPLVTLVIALACFGAGTLISGSGSALDSARLDAASSDEVLSVLGFLAFVNATLLVVQPDPGLPARRRADRARDRLVVHRRPRPRHPLRRAAGTDLLLPDDRRGRLPLPPRRRDRGIWLGFIGFFLGQAARSAEFQTEITSRIEGLLVADVMDAEPVAVPATLPLDRALDEYFLRYGYPWFPVVDADGRLSGLVTRGAAEAVPEAARPGRTVASVMAAERGRGGSGLAGRRRGAARVAAGPRGAAAAGGDHGGGPRRAGCAGS